MFTQKGAPKGKLYKLLEKLYNSWEKLYNFLGIPAWFGGILSRIPKITFKSWGKVYKSLEKLINNSEKLYNFSEILYNCSLFSTFNL